ncbi:hypothetical protein [Chryseobacterium gambrini]|uniref:Lipoprotein n=1 Tax=Chryseobacterium gambrini TaxID=373672 RepID=A0ABM8KB95_9FLAO|nr:hypothetical protein CRDW_33300 [Chryseobacterium gambrini]
MKTIKTLSTFLLLAFSALFLISCRSDSSDDNSGGSSYPKQVSITYRITSTTTSSLLHIGYKNETGGTTDVNNPSLPFTKTFTRMVNQFDNLSLSCSSNTTQTVKLEILVDNKVVNFTDNTSTISSVAYVFP